jgi:hypothetical protein
MRSQRLYIYLKDKTLRARRLTRVIKFSVLLVKRKGGVMFSFIRFGLADNGVLLVAAIFGIALEEHITQLLNFFLRLSPWTLELKEKVRFGVLVAMLGNAISDLIGGFCAGNVKLAVGSFIGCTIVFCVGILWTYRVVRK